MQKAGKYRPPQSGAKKYSKPSPYKNKNWVEYRQVFLKHNPKCYCCGQFSRVVDHVKAHKGNKELFEKSDNMIAMCKSCHSEITQLFDRGVVPDTEGKLKWISRKREITETRITSKVVSWES